MRRVQARVDTERVQKQVANGEVLRDGLVLQVANHETFVEVDLTRELHAEQPQEPLRAHAVTNVGGQ